MARFEPVPDHLARITRHHQLRWQVVGHVESSKVRLPDVTDGDHQHGDVTWLNHLRTDLFADARRNTARSARRPRLDAGWGDLSEIPVPVIFEIGWPVVSHAL